jgi:hypothetical protein
MITKAYYGDPPDEPQLKPNAQAFCDCTCDYCGYLILKGEKVRVEENGAEQGKVMCSACLENQ